MIDERTSALVTGGAHGVGYFLASALAKHGARVTITDIADDVEDVARGLGGNVLGLQVDATDAGRAPEVVAQARAHGDGLTVLVNNVGIADTTNPWDDLDDSLAKFDRAVSANLRAPFAYGRSVVPVMIEQGHGHIVNIGTDHVHNCNWPRPVDHAGVTGCVWQTRSWQIGIADLDVYDMTKWGLYGFTIDWSLALRDKDIQVNSYSMGMVDTPPLRAYFDSMGVEVPVPPLSADAVGSVFVDLIEERPRRSGDIVGLWCGHPAALPAPQPHAFYLD